MAHIAFRRLFPVVVVLVSLACTAANHGEDRARDAEAEASQAELRWKQVKGLIPPHSGETVTFDFGHMVGTLPPSSAATLIDSAAIAPGWLAALPAAPVALLADELFGGKTPSAVLKGTALLFAALVWYCIGLRLDGKYQPVGSAPALARHYVTVLIAVAPVWLMVLVLGRLFNRHNAYAGNNAILWWIWITWAVAGTLIAIRRLSKRFRPA